MFVSSTNQRFKLICFYDAEIFGRFFSEDKHVCQRCQRSLSPQAPGDSKQERNFMAKYRQALRCELARHVKGSIPQPQRNDQAHPMDGTPPALARFISRHRKSSPKVELQGVFAQQGETQCPSNQHCAKAPHSSSPGGTNISGSSELLPGSGVT